MLGKMLNRANLKPMRLKICELNAENLFISLDYHQEEKIAELTEESWAKLAVSQLQRKQKPLKKLWGLASAILAIDPDILMLVEVGGKDSLEHFNRHFLEKKFDAHFIESNSQRSIDLAFLVKKNIGLSVEAFSNRELSVKVNAYQGKHRAKFSRDVAELRLSHGTTTKLILLLTHLKSKISSDQDFQGNDMRRAEAEALAALYERHRRQFPEVPIIVGGDFNSSLASPELKSLTLTDLTDFHEILKTPAADRFSLVHFDYQGKPIPQTLDYLLVSPQLKRKIIPELSCTYRYRSFHDIALPIPESLPERYQMPSDHYPLVLMVDLE